MRYAWLTASMWGQGEAALCKKCRLCGPCSPSKVPEPPNQRYRSGRPAARRRSAAGMWYFSQLVVGAVYVTGSVASAVMPPRHVRVPAWRPRVEGAVRVARWYGMRAVVVVARCGHQKAVFWWHATHHLRPATRAACGAIAAKCSAASSRLIE